MTEENRQQRVDTIMPVFIDTVRYWQKQSGLGARATALIGFSQGAIMALEGVKAQPDLASRVIAFNGRYATLPQAVSAAQTIHLIHGGEDRVIDLALGPLLHRKPCRTLGRGCDAGYRGGFGACH